MAWLTHSIPGGRLGPRFAQANLSDQTHRKFGSLITKPGKPQRTYELRVYIINESELNQPLERFVDQHQCEGEVDTCDNELT